MGYIEGNLNPGELVIRKSGLHWFELAWGILLFWLIYPPILAILRKVSTEIAVTNKRVIGKQGIISRATLDTPLDKITNVSLNQSLLGRIFNYGSLAITTGGEAREFVMIGDPAALKRSVSEQIDAFTESKMHRQAELMAKAMKSAQ